MRIIILLLSYFLPLSLFALVGGNNVYDRPQIVSIHDFNNAIYCTGVVVGIHPLTVITADHCVKGREEYEIVIEGNQPIKVLRGNQQILGLDLAVLIFKSDIKITGLTDKNIFSLDGQKSLGLESYRGKIKMCGFGGEINSGIVSQKVGNLKCGNGLYLGQKSYSSLSHSLYSKKYMIYNKWARNEELRKLKISTIMGGDSGGPLFIQNNGELILIGIATSFLPNSDNIPLPDDCDIDLGAGFQFNWTSVLPSNQLATQFLKQAKERFGADIQGL